ncbi:MAG: chorismate dehydratase [Phycisphaerales bacterium]|jgi:chorismate dehydratase|nr:chorismate dehydratase [Phycisphaerales bacterium]
MSVFRIASVSFLNARPLIHGLERDPRVRLLLDVPSRLLDLLRTGQADVALLPVIDYERLDGLTIIPAGGIGSDGATLTVRIFSRVPIEQIKSLACDPDSHTSVALARIILARRHNLRPEFTDLSRASDGDPTQARLLIGDKVVCEEPRGFPHQLDLGAEWKLLTGLPFVFATWMARAGAGELPLLHNLLALAKDRGLADVGDIIRAYAEPRGWPSALARDYLTKHLRYHVGARELEAMRTFHRFAAEEKIIPAARGLAVLPSDAV